MLITVDKYSTMAPKSETNVKNVERLHFVGIILQQVSVLGERIQLIPWCNVKDNSKLRPKSALCILNYVAVC